MFIGHYGLAFLSKQSNSLPSLAMLFIAVQFLDLLWPIFVLLGIESFSIEPGNTILTPLNFSHYPYSHSLLTSVFWSLLLGSIYYLIKKEGKNALLIGSLVLSHWLLDLLTHAPDLPLSPFGDTKVGLGLWDHPTIEIILELGLFFLGVYFYFKKIKPKRKIAFWLLIVFLLVIHFANLFGPPPPSIEAVAWSANALWLTVLWAWWVEKE